MPKKVVIDRSKWLNAYTRYTLGPSVLLNQNGNMCCLGFVCAAEGISTEDMLHRITPRFIGQPKSLVNTTKGGLYISNTELCNQAMEYNDESSLSKSGRENALKKIFAAEGTYELEFVGDYPSEHASSNT